MAAPTYLRRGSYGVGLQTVDLVASATLAIETDGAVVSDLDIIEKYGLANDTRGYANVIDCTAGDIVITLTPPAADALMPYSRLVLKRIDVDASKTCTLTCSGAGKINLRDIDPAESDAGSTSFLLDIGATVVLEKRINSTQLFMTYGSSYQ